MKIQCFRKVFAGHTDTNMYNMRMKAVLTPGQHFSKSQLSIFHNLIMKCSDCINSNVSVAKKMEFNQGVRKQIFHVLGKGLIDGIIFVMLSRSF